MTLRQNKWVLGGYCESYCRVVTTHHTLEDEGVFPHLRRRDPRLAPVIDQLQVEHEQIHEVLEQVDRALVAFVSEKDGRSEQMSEIAAATNASLSRLSHAVSRLERAGWIERERLPGAGRRTLALLTEDGYDAVVAAAPGHVRRVRELVVDAVDPDGLAALRRVCEQVLAQIDPDRSC